MNSKGNATACNVGEWSKVYAFFRLLGAHVICSWDAKLNRTNEFFPIRKIIRGNFPDSAVFCNYHKATGTWEIKMGKAASIKIGASESTSAADNLLALLLDRNKRPDKFSKVAEFLQRLNIDATEAESQKTQGIMLQIADVRAGTAPMCGFGIMSYLGHPPTLLNNSDFRQYLYTETKFAPLKEMP